MINITLDDETDMVVDSQSISFLRKTPSLTLKLFLFFISGLVMFLLCCFSLFLILLFMELLKSPNIYEIILFLCFLPIPFIITMVMLWILSNSQPHYTCISRDEECIVYSSKRMLSFTKKLKIEDYILINFIYYRRSPYGIGITLGNHFDLKFFFSHYTILDPVLFGNLEDSKKIACDIEKKFNIIFPDLTIINKCKEISN